MSGIFGKYTIAKADGRVVDPEACYFVLRLDSDTAAQVAMRAYADQVFNEAPELSDAINACLDELQRPPCGCREPACPHEILPSAIWHHGDPDDR